MRATLALGEGRTESPKVKALHHRPSRELAVQGSSPVGVAPLMGVASLMGAVGGPVMERLSLAEGPGKRGEGGSRS
jgi:hypothetical protein